MIVPRNRLLWLTALLVPVTLLGVAFDAALTVALLAFLLAAAAALLDLAWARGRGETIRIETPEVVRLTRLREELIPLGITPLQPGIGRVRIGLVLPPEVGSSQDEIWVDPGDATGSCQAAWPCRPLRRGKYLLRSAFWEVTSPFGFWGLRGSNECLSELRVYPDLSRERKAVAAFFLNRGLYGLHAQRMVGRGREFERLREYMAGDSYEEIHWKATARRGAPITKVFQVERTQEVYVVIDASRLTARTPSATDKGPESSEDPPETILERFVSASLVLGMAAEKQGDHFGLLAFGGGVKRFLRAGSGKEHFNSCRDALYTLHPEPVAPDLGEIFTFLRLRLRKRALLVFLTSLEDPLMEENFVTQVDLLARKHLVMVNMLRPAGVGRLFAEHQPPESADELYQRLGGHLRWHDIRETGRKLQHLGVQFSMLENERLSPELVSQYMRVKQRQLV